MDKLVLLWTAESIKPACMDKLLSLWTAESIKPATRVAEAVLVLT